MTDGLLVVDKSRGPTSHDVVAAVRRVTGIRKVGHAGTLDPMATGVVVIGLGRATRLLRYVQEGTKEYVATVRFGVGTDTFDAQGKETWREAMPIRAEEVVNALATFRGEILQVPPMFSALKVGGDRLYELARAGRNIDRQPRPVSIYRLDLVRFEQGDHPQAVLEVECSKGTYIRSLVDDLGRALGGRAHLEALRRTRVGAFRIEHALRIEDLADWGSHLLDPVAAVEGMQTVNATQDQLRAVSHGRPFTSDAPEGELAVLDADGKLLAVYESRDGVAKAAVVLA